MQKLIRLSKKTGDRLIVFDDNNPEDSFVLMGVNDYEKLVIQKSEVRGLTEDELLDKINRDIAIWKSENDFRENESKNTLSRPGKIIYYSGVALALYFMVNYFIEMFSYEEDKFQSTLLLNNF